MPVIDQTGPEDGQFFSDASEEVVRHFEESVTIKRWLSATGEAIGDPLMVSATETFTSIQTSANITALEAKELFFSNTIYEVGDLRMECRIQVFGAETDQGDGNSASAARRADHVIYRGREYRVVGHVARPFETKTQYFECVLRQLDK